jgi:hypothetical protein
MKVAELEAKYRPSRNPRWPAVVIGENIIIPQANVDMQTTVASQMVYFVFTTRCF